MKTSEKCTDVNSHSPRNNFAANPMLRRRIGEWAIALTVGIGLGLAYAGASFAQAIRTGSSSTSTSSTSGFLLYGDVKVDDSKAAGEKPLIMDVILYTKGMQVVARQRISPNGRYRFMNISDGDYWLVIELEGTEVARDSVFIAKASITTDIRHDLALEWRSTGGGKGAGGSGVVSAADLYDRSGPNKSLYQKSAKEIESKSYPQAIATLLGLVAADPRDFPAWSDLGMLYFIQKDYEAAENSYASALKAKPDYFRALLSQGRVQLARKNYTGALESLEAAVKVEPKSASANFFLGEAYLQVKKGSKAVGYLNEALSLDPVGMAEAHLRLAALYNGAGMKDKAAVEYEEFLKTKPDYPDRKKLEEYISANKKP